PPNQSLLFVVTFVGGSIMGRSRCRLCFIRKFCQFALECLADNLVELRVALRGNRLQLGSHGVGFLTGLVGPKTNKPGFWRTPVLPVICWFEDCSQVIVVGLRDRIVPMVMTLGTADGKPEYGG